jgi:hypothetical protein
MKYVMMIVFALGVCHAQAQWLDTTADTKSNKYMIFGVGNGDLLLTEDFQVIKTHEVCASVTGYYLKESALGRYDVTFKGMRTSATFVFTTRYNAEKWAEKWCTPESLLSITGGKGTFARNY